MTYAVIRIQIVKYSETCEGEIVIVTWEALTVLYSYNILTYWTLWILLICRAEVHSTYPNHEFAHTFLNIFLK
jgi:hypothetical protein